MLEFFPLPTLDQPLDDLIVVSEKIAETSGVDGRGEFDERGQGDREEQHAVVANRCPVDAIKKYPIDRPAGAAVAHLRKANPSPCVLVIRRVDTQHSIQQKPFGDLVRKGRGLQSGIEVGEHLSGWY